MGDEVLRARAPSEGDRLRALTDVTRAFAEATTDYDQLLDVVVRRTAEVVGDFCALGLVSDDGHWLLPTAAYDRDPAALAVLRRLFGAKPASLDAPHPTHARTIHVGESVLLREVDPALIAARVEPDDADAARELGIKSLLMVPLRVHGQSLGALTILRHGEGAAPLDERDLSLAEALAGHAAFALTTARLLASERVTRAALGRAEARFRAIVEYSGDGVTLSDARGAAFYRSPAVLRILGYSEGGDPGPRGIEVVHPDDREAIVANYTALLAEPGASRTLVSRSRHRDGSWRWLEVTMTNLLDDPAVGAVVTNGRDVTEHHQMLALLRASEARYRRFIETTSEGVWALDADQRVSFVNARMVSMLGYDDAGQMVGLHIDAFLEADERAASAERNKLRRVGVGGQVEARLRRRDGAPVWVLMESTPVFDAEGRYEGVLAMGTDVTARRAADAERARLAAIVESSDDAILGKDLEGRITSWNDGAERLYGYPRAEMLGRMASVLVSPDHPDEETDLLARVARGERVLHFDTERVRRDGKHIPVSLSVSPIRDADGRVVGASSIARDLTARRELELQLRQAQKMEAVGRLAGGVAHDFNNLLSVILGYSELLLGDLDPGGPMTDDLVEVKRAAERAAGLTRQLLAFSRQQILAPRVLDLAAAVADTEKMLRRLVGEDVEIRVVAGPHCRCKVDPSQAEQVLMNLVVNARDAMPLGGRLTIETSAVELDAEYAHEHMEVASGLYVLLAVSDTGCGMDAATQARIFEPFFTTKEQGKGTGLGLSTVFGIVKQSGGHVSVYSEPGVGTTFKVYLPRVDDAAEPVATSLLPSLNTRGSETVLLVEDEEALRALMRGVLRRHGYHVLDAANAADALAQCEQFGATIDLLLTDVIMPRMSGRQLAERLAPARPAMRVLYMSGYTADSIVQHGVLDADIAFLPKPVTPAALLRKLREVLDAPPGGEEPDEA